jgi:hypothetical protein
MTAVTPTALGSHNEPSLTFCHPAVTLCRRLALFPGRTSS